VTCTGADIQDRPGRCLNGPEDGGSVHLVEIGTSTPVESCDKAGWVVLVYVVEAGLGHLNRFGPANRTRDPRRFGGP
jgi:hypothetical protein